MPSQMKGPSCEKTRSKMKTISKEAAKEEWTLGYFHGALMDQDVELLLKTKGDFLLQLKSPGQDEKTFLVVKESKKPARRFEISHEPSADSSTAVKLEGGKSFSSIGALVKHHKKAALPEGQDLLLVKAIPRDKFNIWHSDVKIGSKIGSGAYGTVFKGTVKSCGKQVIAIKQIDAEGDDDALKEMMKEARVMQLYDHRNIVRFYGFVVDRMPYLLVMEFCDGGAVEDKLRSKGKALSIITRADWCAQAAAGMEYLHSKECIHRDIAARNCLLDRSVVKMADFGMCRPTGVYKVDVTKPMNVRWLAPEVWTSAETRYNTDVFAFGVLLWEMFEIPYHTPYDGLRAIEVKTKTQEGYRMSPPEAMPEPMAEVMEKAWHQDAAKRPDAKKLRRMVDAAYKKIEAGGGKKGAAGGGGSKSNAAASDEKA